MKSNSPVDCWASSAGRRCILTICLWQIGSESLPVPSKSRYPLGCLLFASGEERKPCLENVKYIQNWNHISVNFLCERL